MHEGILDRFDASIDEWLTCPPLDESKSRPYPPAEKLQQLPLVVRTLAEKTAGLKTPPTGLPPTDDNIICPYAWAAPMHQLNCDIIWPPALDALAYLPDDGFNSYLELDTPEYAGRIEKEFLMEKLLAMGGIRLAAILNYLFAVETNPLYRA